MKELKGIPTRDQALDILKEAEMTSPGVWIEHSKNVARAARIIAHRTKNINPDYAFSLGLLHDIGRKDGAMHMRHIFVGYQYLSNLGYETAARICLTHSFAYKDINGIYGKWDCSQSEIDFISQYITKTKYDIYDKLIQLCDSFSMSNGYLLIEKKMVNSIINHGINEETIHKLKAVLDLKNYFDKEVGESIYNLLPGVIQNTFGFTIR
ncbi:MAG: HD domain-containing protein [Clostridia bacterium]|nr:HD domain-containing protein [Clostridia bacterium]